jgi:ERCC4-related helicase
MTVEGTLEAREYQKKIADTASGANTLVVLPTGLGKTIIAVMVAAKRLQKFPRGKAVILAPTRPLTTQHYETFRKLAQFPRDRLVVLTGTTSPSERAFLWDGARVIFATPQTVANDLKKGRVSMKDVVLVVFDEAHRCVRDYSYTRVAKEYRETADSPLIMGLTASPGASRTKIEEIKQNLFIDRVESRSEEDEDVSPYIEKTEIEAFRVSLPQEYQQTVALVREIFNEKVKKLRNAGFLSSDRVTKRALLDARASVSSRLAAAQRTGGQKGYIFGAIINQAQAVMILHALEVLETQGSATMVKYLTRLREKPEQGKATQYLLSDPRWARVEKEATELLAVKYPKLEKLTELVKEQMVRSATSKVIVFTQYRDTIEEIVSGLVEQGFKARRFVGQADRTGSEGMDQEKQKETLAEFTDGEFSILVSSSIGEEGLHVPDVDLVVFYEAVPSEIRNIQRRGRTGRTMKGRVAILLAEGTVDEGYYLSSLSRERRMRSLVREGMAGTPKRRGKNPTLLDFVD